MSTKGSRINYPLFIKEDVDGFFALFQNNLADFVIIAIGMLGLGFPSEIVYGRVIPGAAISVIVGNFYYAHLAKKLAEKENRTDVTALSYGVSTPVLFVYLYGIIAPVLVATNNNYELTWKIGVAACFLGGFLESIMSIFGAWLHKALPRAAMLGALAGVALTVVSGKMFFRTFEMPVVTMMVLGIIIIGLIANKKMPFNIPSTLFAMIIGTALAYILKQVDFSQIKAGLDTLGFYPPLPRGAFLAGLKELFIKQSGFLAVIIPITLYNAIETINNVEAMASAGDEYSVNRSLLTDGVGTMLGAVFGSCYPTTVYMASVSAKWQKAGRGYSILNGVVFLIAATFGVIGAMSAIMPEPVVAPILVFVGISMTAQCFSSVNQKHYPAAILAIFPYLADFVVTNFGKVAPEAVEAMSSALLPLSQGPMFSGIIWATLAVFIIEDDFIKAAITSFVGMGMSAVGFIHSPKLSWLANKPFTLGYMLLGILLLLFYIYYKKNPDNSETLYQGME